MAKKSTGRAYAGMGSIRGGSKEVNPSFSVKKTPSATPSNGGKQVNPTFSAGKSTGPKATHGMRLNPTFSVAKPGAEDSKGKSGRKFVAMKNKVGSPLATKSNPTPLKATYKSKTNAVGAKIFATPTRNIKGGIGKGPKATSASKVHSVKGTHDVSVPTRNEMAPYGANGIAKAPMTVKRLTKMGF